jgi:hypothetical protein
VVTDGAKASNGTFADAASFGDPSSATLGVANENALKMAGPERMRAIVIDTTNPLDFSGACRRSPDQRQLAASKFSGCYRRRSRQAFNIVGNAFMFKPDFPAARPTCSSPATTPTREEGRRHPATSPGVIDIGGIEGRGISKRVSGRVLAGIHGGNWNQAFKMLKK